LRVNGAYISLPEELKLPRKGKMAILVGSGKGNRREGKSILR